MLQADWQALCLGAVPFREGEQAWRILNEHLTSWVGWPQLPRRSRQEGMYLQFSERFPGLDVNGDILWVDPRRNLDYDLEALYLAYLEGDLEHGRISESFAQGLAQLLDGQVTPPTTTRVLIGRLTGPISWGVSVVDRTRRPLLNDPVLADAVSKHLRLKAAWQEAHLRPLAPQTLILIEEPYMASFGSAYVGASREQVIELFEEVFAGLAGLKGVHCCGNTDWSVLLGTRLDLLSLDAYDYAQTLLAHAEGLTQFLERGGLIAWGIVPASAAASRESVESLVTRLERSMERLVERGVPRERLLQQGLVSPSCGLGALSPSLAEDIVAHTAAVSAELRRRYVANPS
jgi:hypothetical protein